MLEVCWNILPTFSDYYRTSKSTIKGTLNWKNIATRKKNKCSALRLYISICPCYNLTCQQESKRDRREHLLSPDKQARNSMFRVMQRTAKQSLYRLVTFRNTNSTRFYIVLRCFEKQVLVTFIRNIAKVRIYARAKWRQITNFGHILELFSGSPRR